MAEVLNGLVQVREILEMMANLGGADKTRYTSASQFGSAKGRG